MNVARPALVALLVGLALLGSPALLLQFQEPTECANRVDPAADVADPDPAAPVLQYAELSSRAQRAFDSARSSAGSATVTGDACPGEFEYGVDRSQYVVVRDDSRYVLTTYRNDLLPEVPLAAGVAAYLGLALVALGVATRADPDARFPAALGVTGATALVAVTATVVLDRHLWLAVAWTGLVTAVAFVGAGATLPTRRAVALGGALAVLPAVAVAPFAGVSAVLVAPAVAPFVLVGAGVATRQLGTALTE